jgi:hypothetical protein
MGGHPAHLGTWEPGDALVAHDATCRTAEARRIDDLGFDGPSLYRESKRGERIATLHSERKASLFRFTFASR